jgi:hypothetical protein
LRFAGTPEFTRKDPYAVKVDWENRLLAPNPAPAVFEYDVVLYGSYDPGADENWRRLRERLELLGTFDRPPPRFPHNPTVFIFRRRP